MKQNSYLVTFGWVHDPFEDCTALAERGKAPPERPTMVGFSPFGTTVRYVLYVLHRQYLDNSLVHACEQEAEISSCSRYGIPDATLPLTDIYLSIHDCTFQLPCLYCKFAEPLNCCDFDSYLTH